MPINNKIHRFCLDNDNNLSASLIILASVMLSIWMIAIDPTLNRDGIFYLLTAETYIQNGLAAATAQYNWPWFLILPASLHQLTGIELHHTALLSITLWYVLLSYAFVRLVKQLGGDRTTQIFALFIILFHPIMANYRSGIGRDSGFWAFSLLAIAEAVAFSATSKLRHALLWAAYAMAAVLFRVEGFILFISTPFIVLAIYIKEHRQGLRLKHYLWSGVFIAVLALILSATLSKDLKLFSELSFHASKLLSIQDEWEKKSEQIGSIMLAHTSAEKDAEWALFGGYAGIYGSMLWRSFTPLYFILIAYFLFSPKISQLQQKQWRIIHFTAAIVALYLFAFTLNRGFMLKRYSLQLFIFLALTLPFIFNYLWHNSKHPKISKKIILFILFLYAGDTLHTSDAKKGHIIDAANWINDNTSANAYVVANEGNLAYFSHRKTNWRAAIHGKTRAYQLNNIKPKIIYAIRIKYDEQAGNKLLDSPKINILKIFNGEDGDKVVIYKKA